MKIRIFLMASLLFFTFSGFASCSGEEPGTIQAGDLMLSGSSCVMLFYKTFRTSYTYTRLGHVDRVSELAAALGNGSVTVAFEVTKD